MRERDSRRLVGDDRYRDVVLAASSAVVSYTLMSMCGGGDIGVAGGGGGEWGGSGGEGEGGELGCANMQVVQLEYAE